MEKILSFCGDDHTYVLKLENVIKLVDFCYWQTKKSYDNLFLNFGITFNESKVFCGYEHDNEIKPTSDISKRKFEDYQNIINAEMSSLFGCFSKSHCSRIELLAMQWTSSTVTMNPPPNSGLPKTDSIVDWVPKNYKLSYFRFEFPAYAKLYNKSMPKITNDQAVKLISYDRMISPLSIAKAICEFNAKGDNSWSKNQFFFPDVNVFDSYLKYLILDGFFEGTKMENTFHDTIFGFTSDALHFIKYRNPMLGGDPTIDANPIM